MKFIIHKKISAPELFKVFNDSVVGKTKICVTSPDLWSDWYWVLPTINLDKFLRYYKSRKRFDINENNCADYMIEMMDRVNKLWGNVAFGGILFPPKDPFVPVRHGQNWRYNPDTNLIELIEPQTGVRTPYPTGTKYNSCMG